ncbi:MAG: imidazole glycerol phosphate synthase subunit HisH [Firmicutes bacterium]|nr:imidazole glycerol phosphate synthase subunit HisH [Bacillota bacterium]
MIGVIDYRAGNAPSVYHALRRIGATASLVRTPEEIEQVDGLILPGVGAADATIVSLEEDNLIDAIYQEVLFKHKPFLGICVGLQIMFEHSDEDDTPCLGWLAGEVRQFPKTVRVPQIGYNEVRFLKDHPLVEDMGASDYFYFVNSYYAVPEDDIVLAEAEYGLPFCAMVASRNMMASQFHMEKSGQSGLKMLHNYVRIVEEGIPLC